MGERHTFTERYADSRFHWIFNDTVYPAHKGNRITRAVEIFQSAVRSHADSEYLDGLSIEESDEARAMAFPEGGKTIPQDFLMHLPVIYPVPRIKPLHA